MKRIAWGLGLMALGTANTAWAEDCVPRVAAPGAFLNTPRYWGTTDSGPILRGFLELRDGASMAPIKHGVDLSHNNARVPYGRLKQCGAEFAIVKMDGAFKSHYEQLKGMGLAIVPYSFLSVADQSGHDYKRFPAQFAAPGGSAPLSPAQLSLLMEAAERIGRFKATDFVTRYNAALSPDKRHADLAGLSGQIVVLDVEENFDSRRYPSTQIQRITFGRFYARMLSTWISEVRKSMPSAVFVFYTFPDIYTSYLQFAYPADNSVIHGMPVWLARTAGDGSDFNLTSNKNLQRICLSSSGGNKCIIHQYSHRAVFNGAALGPRVPDHIDVDRLFPVTAVRDQNGVQYVRTSSVGKRGR